ncbi:hypothetical protein SPSYN_01411 [Sporotomaculum syntrophicum]|uniref:Fibronectin type-III domain-containing protein n=1 Tax=Sporotomaculum syntrophicum TaxID=182264 RepID=A0A9D2WPP0_9FIRM|nr:stalk domain-containing protein [Sporotomaculum syntrophicum]KAF1085275.1 hypothetical protein SPSYN_01411 [Sporotomaculum syntrophicum]
MRLKKHLQVLFFFSLIFCIPFFITSKVDAAPPPAAPSDLIAIATSANSIYLTWQDNSGADNPEACFMIYRGEHPGGSTTYLTSVKRDFNEFTVTDLSPNQTYYFSVKAYSDWGSSEASNEANATTSPPFANLISLQIGSPDMLVNGKQQKIDPGRNTTPMVIDGRSMVPIKSIIEAMGGEVAWDSVEQKVSVKLKDSNVEVWIGSNKAKVNGLNAITDTAPSVINGRTMLPLRFISENLGSDVKYNSSTQKVTIIQR